MWSHYQRTIEGIEMNKTTEALKLAEEALEELHYSSGTVKAVTLYKSALAAIREALAEQDKQKPVASVVAMLDKCISIIGTEMNHCKQAGDKWFMCQRFIHAIQDMQYEFKRDYAAPVSAKREWVDLTDDEIDEAYEQAGKELRRWQSSVHGQTVSPADFLENIFARVVIAAFKEKNR